MTSGLFQYRHKLVDDHGMCQMVDCKVKFKAVFADSGGDEHNAGIAADM